MERPLNFLWAFNRLVDGIGGKNVNLSIDVQLTIGMLLICLTTLPQIIVYKYWMRSGRHLSSANPVTPRSGRKYHDTCQDTSYEEYQQAKKSIANHTKTMVHASRCKSDNYWQPYDITLLVDYPRGISTSN